MGRKPKSVKKQEEVKEAVAPAPPATENANTRTKKTLESRNQKFMDFYKTLSATTDFTSIKPHKRVRYLSEQFEAQNHVKMPVGTIYKLISGVVRE